MEFITAREAAKKWGISRRRVQTLCAQSRIIGAKKVGMMWIIPIDAKKPLDRRKSSGDCII